MRPFSHWGLIYWLTVEKPESASALGYIYFIWPHLSFLYFLRKYLKKSYIININQSYTHRYNKLKTFWSESFFEMEAISQGMNTKKDISSSWGVIWLVLNKGFRKKKHFSSGYLYHMTKSGFTTLNLILRLMFINQSNQTIPKRFTGLLIINRNYNGGTIKR